jgi:hypothetical protein
MIIGLFFNHEALNKIQISLYANFCLTICSIYVETGKIAEWFTSRFSAGMLGVNIGVPVPREPFSFGGFNASKFGDCDITGDGSLVNQCY